MQVAKWETHSQGNIWEFVGEALSEYVEAHYKMGLNSCDFADHANQQFFRIFFNFMCIQNLRDGFVRRVRRIQNVKIDNEKLAKEITEWEKIDISKVPKDDTCSLCLCDFHDEEEDMEDDEIVHLNSCGPHYFHKACIMNCFQEPENATSKGHLKCPICSKLYGIRYGTMPFGVMKVSEHPNTHLPGYESFGTIHILYSFPPGIQGPEHPVPGELYSGTVRNCFLPDNEEGKEVLKKLKIAFERRLTFIVGTSITSGRSNTVVWNGIHHKTNTTGGPPRYGYPDPTYLGRVTQELANVGIL